MKVERTSSGSISSAVSSHWRILSRKVIRSDLSVQRLFWLLDRDWIARSKQKQEYQLGDRLLQLSGKR